MQGSSRSSLLAVKEAFAAVLDSGADPAALAEDLFGIVGAFDDSAALRRALGDPSREGPAKAALADRLFGGKVADSTLGLLRGVVAQRWSQERDASDALEQLAVGAVVAGAENAGRADQVEDELFRFERVVAGTPDLRDALTDRRATVEAKTQLVQSLLEGKTAPETLRLARQAVLASRGRRFDRVLDTYQSIAETRREQLAAIVTSAVDLDDTQRGRLVAALASQYGKAVHVNVIIDRSVIGGIRVQIGDDVVDGTVLRRLEGVRRQLGG